MTTPDTSSSDADSPLHGHLVSFHADDEDLVATVASFLTPGVDDGVVLVVATPEHHAAFTAALADAGRRVDTGESYVWLDAETMLRALLRDGVPDPRRFRALLGPVIERQVASGRAVRVYGEMVALLWDRGEVTAAMHLEQLWNELAEDLPFLLLCGYPTRLFDDDEDAAAIERICAAHASILARPPPSSDTAVHDRMTTVVHEDAARRATEHTALRRERDELRARLDEAVEVERQRQRFAAMVVHDIRNPTAVISGLTHLMQERLDDLDLDQLRDFLATAARNAARVERLLDDILTVARLEAGEFDYDLVPMDLASIVDEVAEQVGGAAGRSITVIAPAAELPPALADPDRQVQILTNLLTNAAKFSSLATPITVHVRRRDDMLAVAVRDRGRGVPARDLPRLFQPFARVESRDVDRVHGTGLGLYITKALVEGQGGMVEVGSEPGRGTTVTYTVPVASTTEAACAPAGVARDSRR